MSKATKVFKKLTNKARKRCWTEISELEAKLKAVSSNNFKSTIGNYSARFEEFNGIKYLYADARALNNSLNSSGRGNFRYLFQPSESGYAFHGLAAHGVGNKPIYLGAV